MPFEPPNAQAIRDRVLALLRAEYLAVGRDLDVLPGSDAFMRAAVISLILEGIHQLAKANTTQIFADTAALETLEHFARLYGIQRKPASGARLRVRVQGEPNTAWSAGPSLQAPDGSLYTLVAGGVVGSDGRGDVDAESQGLGTKTNKTSGSPLTWNSSPPGMFTQATVLALMRAGSDAENDTSLANRVLAYLRERPGSGNRADWRAWAEEIPGVDRAFVYPLLHDVLGPATPGSTTLVLLGPSGRTLLSPTEIADATQTLRERCPAGMPSHDLFVMTPRVVPVSVQMRVLLGVGFRWSFSGTHVVGNASTPTRVVLTTQPALPGPSQLSEGSLVAIVSPSERGGVAYRRVTRVHIDAVELDSALLDVPRAGDRVFPASTNALALRDAVLALFDRLGPGEGYAPSLRFPSISETAPPTLYKASLIAAVMGTPGVAGAPAGVAGVLNATVPEPLGDVTAPTLSLLIPSSILFVA